MTVARARTPSNWLYDCVSRIVFERHTILVHYLAGIDIVSDVHYFRLSHELHGVAIEPDPTPTRHERALIMQNVARDFILDVVRSRLATFRIHHPTDVGILIEI